MRYKCADIATFRNVLSIDFLVHDFWYDNKDAGALLHCCITDQYNE